MLIKWHGIALPVGVGGVGLGHLCVGIQDDDVVGLGPLVVSRMDGIHISDERQGLLAAVEGHMQAAGHLTTLTGTGHIQITHIAYIHTQKCLYRCMDVYTCMYIHSKYYN